MKFLRNLNVQDEHYGIWKIIACSHNVKSQIKKLVIKWYKQPIL